MMVAIYKILFLFLYTVKIGGIRESSAQRGDLPRSRRDVACSGDKSSPGSVFVDFHSGFSSATCVKLKITM